MFELYLKGGDGLPDCQENDLKSLENSLSEYFYYSGSDPINKIEDVDPSTGDVIRVFSPKELLDFEGKVHNVVKTKHDADADFLGTIEAAKESLKINLTY